MNKQAHCEYCGEVIAVSTFNGTLQSHLACPARMKALEAEIARKREAELDKEHQR